MNQGSLYKEKTTRYSEASSPWFDVPFSVRLTLPSIVMVGLVLLLGGSVRDMVETNLDKTTGIVQKSKETNKELIGKNFQGAAKLGHISNEVQRINGLFYEILALQASKESQDGAGKIMLLRSDAEKVVADLDDYKRNYADENSAKVIQGLIDEMGKYYIGKNHDGIFDVSATMMQVDLDLILRGMDNYRHTFSSLQTELEILSEKAMNDSIKLAANSTHQMEAEASEMADESRQSLKKIMILLAGGSFFSIIFSFFFARVMASSIRKIAMKFEKVASNMIVSLTSSSMQMGEIAERVSTSSKKTCSDSERMAESVLRARENVQVVAASSEQLAQSSMRISGQIANVADTSSRAAQEAVVTHGKVKDLNEIADDIEGVVNAIKAIADQTNLLALNATIEAARAGAAGKGFAVVADEVKKLAVETSDKTKEVGERVERIQSAVRSAVNAVDKILTEVRKIDVATSDVSSVVEEQSMATSEINRSVGVASEQTGFVMGAVSTVIDSAHENERASVVVLDAANTLSEVSSQLKLNTQEFITEILHRTK